MIKLHSTPASELILQKRPPLQYKHCMVCCERVPITAINELCPSCGYPYQKFDSCLSYLYSEHLKYFKVGLTEVVELFNTKYLSLLNPCAFCGSDALLDSQCIQLFDRYYPDDSGKAGEFKDTLSSHVLFLHCTGCTFSTPYLYLYQFYAFYDWLIEAWDMGQSRLPVVKYVELDLPEWSLNNFILKGIKKYAAQYQEKFKPQQDIFC